MLLLDCDSLIKGNSAFGPKTIGKPNYELYIAKCPMNCHSEGSEKVFGLGIHPNDASICKSAIYDNSMPLMGGVIGIGI